MANVIGLLADEERLRVVAALVLGSTTLAEVGSVTGLDARAAGRALARLEDGGLAEQVDGDWRLCIDVLKAAARAAAPRQSDEDFGAVDRETDKVLRAFVRDGRLTGIPAVRSKRLVVLDHVSRVFEPGVRYAETEVGVLLRAFHDDYAALRRYLVDEGFLTREGGEYWRSGGTYDVG